jgi:hypothetical protein
MYKTYPYYFNTPMYSLPPCYICKMYSCPYCVNTPMYNPNFSRQLTSYANDEDRNIMDFVSTLNNRGFIVQKGKFTKVV